MIYADCAGSTPLDEKVKNYLLSRLDSDLFGNPNSIHYLGTKLKMALEKSREICAKSLGAKKHQVIFNSGSTEGLALAIHSALKNTDKKEIITTEIEHSAVSRNLEKYESAGYSLKKINTLENGKIDLEHFKSLVSESTALIAVMAVNNESGVIQPYQEVLRVGDELNIPTLLDSTQLIGKEEFDFNNSKASFAVVSGHKLGALPGIGILLVKDPGHFDSFILGGGQESDLRSGTQNYIGIETLAVIMEDLDKKTQSFLNLKSKRSEFESKLKEAIPSLVVFGKNSDRVGDISFMAIPGVHSQAIQIELESRDIFISTSSACGDNEPRMSHVLEAMGVKDSIGHGSFRISFGLDLEKNYPHVIEGIVAAYNKLKKLKSL